MDKIALIAPTHLPSRRANTIQVMKMAQAIADSGRAVHVLVPGEGRGVEGRRSVPWDDLAAHYGLATQFPVTWLPASPALRSYDYGWQAASWAKNWGADWVYTRHPQAAAVASWMGVGTVLEMHDFPQGRVGPFLFRLFLKGRGTRRLVSITKALASDLLASFPILDEQLVTAPDGVDLARYENLLAPEAARRALGTLAPDDTTLPDRFTVGYTGHLYPGRGGEHLLAVAAKLPNVTFLLVGGNPEDVARMRSEAKSTGLHNVRLTGFVPNAELPRYQAACDVLLMPYQKRIAASSGGDISKYLSPMKLFEYLACGRAILCSDLRVLREILDETNAVLLPSDDADAWANAITRLQHATAERETLTQNAKSTAAQYTWDKRVARIFAGL